MRRLILSHLFKWRGVRLKCKRETHLWGKTVTKHWEKKERENHCGFLIPTREHFSNCNCGFVHRWIRLIFGQQVLHTWYFKLFGWIIKKISGERNKYFSFSVLYFGVSFSCLYCTNWGLVLIWLFVACQYSCWRLSRIFIDYSGVISLVWTTCNFYPCIERFFMLNKLWVFS